MPAISPAAWSARPAAVKILDILSNAALSFCKLRKPTAAPDTMIEQTKHTASTTPTVLPKVSFLADTSDPPLDVTLRDEIIE